MVVLSLHVNIMRIRLYTTNYHRSHLNIYNNYIIKHLVLVIPILKMNTLDVSVFTAEYHTTHVYYTTKICLSIYKINFNGKCRSILMFLMDYYLCILDLLIHTFNGPIMVIHLVLTPYSRKLLTVYNWKLLMLKNIIDSFLATTGDTIVHHTTTSNNISVLPFNQISDEQLITDIHGVKTSVHASIQDKINELDKLIITDDRDDSSILSEIDPDLNMLFDMNDTIQNSSRYLDAVTSVNLLKSIKTISLFLMLISEAWLPI